MAGASAESATQALSELSPATASIGEWVVTVHKQPQVASYSYKWNGKVMNSKKIDVLLISEDAEAYCIGRAKCSSANPRDVNALTTLAAKFKSGSIWKITKVCLMAEPKPHLGCSVKVVVDLSKTKLIPMLQSAVPMPVAPAPIEQLSDILAVKTTQRCDVTCLLQHVQGEPKTVTTRDGERKLVEVAICDGSEDQGETAKLTFPIWLPAGETGTQEHSRLLEAFQEKQPISLFGLYVEPQVDDAVKCKTSRDFWWMPCPEAQDTTKVEKLRTEAETILALSMKEIAAADDWRQEAVDYTAGEAHRVNVQLLQTIVHRESAALPLSEEGGSVIFQLNCVRLLEPAPGEELSTKCGTRLFVPVRVMDDWGQMTLRMRESAALQVSGQKTKEDFEKAVQQGGLRFPILASIRVRVKRGASTTPSEGAQPHSQDDALMDAIIVEAVTQALDSDCRPNASLIQVTEASKLLGGGSACMLGGTLSQVQRAPHAGLCVGATCCEFALVLCAVREPSDMQKLTNGYRIVTAGLHEVTISKEGDTPRLIETPVKGQFVSMCTVENSEHFNLTPSNPQSGTYYLALISNVISTKDSLSYIVDRVSQPLQSDDRLPTAQLLEEMIKLAKHAKPDERPKRSATWAQDLATSLKSAKRAKALSREPTEAPLPETQE